MGYVFQYHKDNNTVPLREAINRAEGNWGPQLFIGMWQIQCAKTSLEQLFGCVLNCSQLGGHSSTFLLMLQSIHSYTNSYKITLTCLELNDVCSEFEPGPTGWKAKTNPLSYVCSVSIFYLNRIEPQWTTKCFAVLVLDQRKQKKK